MKSDAVFKAVFNQLLETISQMRRGEPLPSETALSSALAVSRSTLRKALGALEERGIVRSLAGRRRVAKPNSLKWSFPKAETLPASAQVEQHFMEWMLRGDARPGQHINELELARQFGVGTTAVREFLNRFSRFGLIQKRPSSGWRFEGFTSEFGLELSEIRELFELRSALAMADLPPSSPIWSRLQVIEREHHSLLRTINRDFHDFSQLDDRFHRLINEAAPNRFIDDFYDVIAFIFHYHYQWNKVDEKARNRAAVLEHIDYIHALQSRDRRAVESACLRHLASARRTLALSIAAPPTGS